MTIDTDLTWPLDRAGDALVALAAATGLEHRRVDLGAPVKPLVDWLGEVARWIGVHAQPTYAPLPDVEAMLRGTTPALVVLPECVVAVVAVHGQQATVLTPLGARRRLGITALADALRAPHEAQIPLDARLAPKAAKVLAAARLRFTRVGGVLAIRHPAEAPLKVVIRTARLTPRFAAVALAHALSFVLGLAAWWTIGHGALNGQLDRGWLAAWALLLISAVMVRGLGMWIMGRLVIDAGALLRERLLVGALRISPDLLRADGVGLSLGRVFESSVFEQLAISGGFRAMFAAVEIAIAGVVLAAGAGGWIHVALLVTVIGVTAVVIRRYFHRRRAWTDERLTLTHELVESMVGATTRLAQQSPAQRHVHEDRSLAGYTIRSAGMDRSLTLLHALLPSGWLVLATAILAPILAVSGATPTSLAIALGGVLLAHRALRTLVEGITHVLDAVIAWRALAPLVAAADRAPAVGPPALALAPPSPGVPAVTVVGAVYRAPRRAEPILAGADLTVTRGEHVRLEGPSGSGKSTLAAILSGLRVPEAGLVLSGGLDHSSLGASGWRRRIVCAPHFHENHLFTGPLGFNLLVERWPPRPEDLAEARAVCNELGLGPLIDRMPAGMFEMVGETGWQLSHGERSRIYVARALLQHAEVVVLDESLGALDPDTLALTIACVEKRAPSAIVIAHP